MPKNRRNRHKNADKNKNQGNQRVNTSLPSTSTHIDQEREVQPLTTPDSLPPSDPSPSSSDRHLPSSSDHHLPSSSDQHLPSSSDHHLPSSHQPDRSDRDYRESFERQQSSGDQNLARDAQSPPHHSGDRKMDAQLSTQMASMKVDRDNKMRPMRRPGYGTVGKPVKIDTNFFRMNIQSDVIVSQYAVEILQLKHPSELDPKRKRNRRDHVPKEEYLSQRLWKDTASLEPIFFNRAIFNLFLARNSRELGTRIAYDGRSIAYAPRRRVNAQLLGHEFRLSVGREGGAPSQQELEAEKAIEVKLIINHAKDLKLDKILESNPDTVAAGDVLSAIDNVIASSPMKKYVQVGRSFYNPSESTPLSRTGKNSTVSAWRGFYQSARLSNIGLLLNVDESFTTFWNLGGRSLMELVQEANDGRDPWGDHRAIRMIAQKLKALKVRAVHNGITYKVHGFSSQSADHTTFEDGQGRRVSISDYFADTYNKRLRYGNLPCVKTHPKRDTFLPIEMLVVTEKQRMMGLLTPDQTAVMVRRASVKPNEKRQAALNTIRGLNLNNDQICRDFGIGVDDKLVRVNARVLPPPSIMYKKRGTKGGVQVPARVDRGQWRCGGDLFMAASLTKWLVLVESNAAHRRVVVDFVRDLTQAAGRVGMAMTEPEIYESGRNQLHSDMKKFYHDYMTGKKKGDGKPLQMIVIVKANQDASVYNKVKLTGDVELGLPTQVVLARNLRNPRGLSMYCDNVILKINSKLGGQNCTVAPYKGAGGIPDVPFLGIPHIILGADVTHPMPGGRTPSVAALVGSRDREGVQFSAAIRNQTGRQEVIEELGDMFKEVYQHWRNNFGNKVHAKKVIMFRDGVSEGQFSEVMTKELEALRMACKQVAPNFSPDITYIIVTKRHHTKLFPDRQDGDRNGNVLPGTVVDRDITSGEFYDFYLNSHAGIQGTNKPSKYTVLVDESKMSVDSLQAFVYRLSHGFVRCNRSVSMVNSAYYAHLLAFRGRAYLGDDFSDTASTMSSEVPTAPRIERMLARRLFFV